MPLRLSPTQAAFNARDDGSFNVPFAQQAQFLRNKLNLPTERFDDILKAAHDRAFVVAGAMKADLLTDFHDAVNRAAQEGKSIQWFRQNFKDIVRKHGWEGWTGSDTKAGRDWRARVIYQTNLTTSYAAGRWAQLNDPDLIKLRPYWKYVHNDSVRHPRPLHVSWSGMVLKHDDPWWKTHFPPNGWGCRCRVTAVSARQYDGDAPPDDGSRSVKDTAGQAHQVPNGIDYGWDYAPGSGTDAAFRSIVQEKLVRYPPAITKALSHDVNRYINAHEDISDFVAKHMNDKSMPAETLWLGFVENPENIKQAAGFDATGYLVLLPSDAVNHIVKHHEWDGDGQRLARPEDYRLLLDAINFGELKRGDNSDLGQKRIIAILRLATATLRAVFEIRTGKKNRALSLVTLAVKDGS